MNEQPGPMEAWLLEHRGPNDLATIGFATEILAFAREQDAIRAVFENALRTIMTIRGNVYLSGADMAIQMDKVAADALTVLR